MFFTLSSDHSTKQRRLVSYSFALLFLPLLLRWRRLFQQNSTIILPYENTTPCINQIIAHTHPIGIWYYDPYKKQWWSAAHVLADCATGGCFFGDRVIWMIERVDWSDVALFSGWLLRCGSWAILLDDVGDGSWLIVYTLIDWKYKKIPVVETGGYINTSVTYWQSWSPLLSWRSIRWVISRKYENWAIIERIP